ncbi:hypothetical protein KNV32_gp76 [uncultured phage cr3_1]|jgi:hypothetical protein|uniref:Uncharacterized protein n=1 Tax=uncultured phage cr3_1 TaxID=2772065 RepID=A0A7M1S045_9CAUD|nr:hypothetical protein KNV32_gp76 [uncultured phage cr3_1]QOR58630.1 hypothetical protein [uncultured phage cr3_1]
MKNKIVWRIGLIMMILLLLIIVVVIGAVIHTGCTILGIG